MQEKENIKKLKAGRGSLNTHTHTLENRINSVQKNAETRIIESAETHIKTSAVQILEEGVQYRSFLVQPRNCSDTVTNDRAEFLREQTEFLKLFDHESDDSSPGEPPGGADQDGVDQSELDRVKPVSHRS